MKMKKYLILAIVSFSILIVLWPAQQITGKTSQSAKEKKTDGNLSTLGKLVLSYKRVRSDEKEILQGLEGVRVLVEYIKPEVEKYGLTKQDLQTDTELLLRQYGIKVLTTDEEWLSTPGMPLLSINVNVVVREEMAIASAAIEVELNEMVLLLRKPKRICIGACTWQRNSVVSVRLDRIKLIRESVKNKVNEFINDYLAANPKESPVKEEEEKPKDD